MSDSPAPTPPDPAAADGAPDVTRLLHDAAAGDARSSERLLPLVYEQLRRSAQKHMNHERRDHTLHATALVHEAYIRLVGSDDVSWASRAHFYHATGEAMRRILIEHARSKSRLKRGGDGARAARKISLAAIDLAAETDPIDVVLLDDAFRRLEAEDPRAASVVRLRFYAGLSVDETAAALGMSPSTVDREWAFARATLHRMIRQA